jgi:type II secretory pathway pseudopilin PulG
MSDRQIRLGWTLIELMIILMILGFLGAALLRVFTYGLRNTQRVMDVTDQTQIGAIILRALDRDLGLALPGPIQTTLGEMGGPIEYAPDSRKATAFIFWVMEKGRLWRVRYEFNPGGAEIQRSVIDGQGNLKQQHSFGSGFIRAFEVTAAPGQGPLLRVSLTLVGKQKALRTFCRWYRLGFTGEGASKFWKLWTASP